MMAYCGGRTLLCFLRCWLEESWDGDDRRRWQANRLSKLKCCEARNLWALQAPRECRLFWKDHHRSQRSERQWSASDWEHRRSSQVMIKTGRGGAREFWNLVASVQPLLGRCLGLGRDTTSSSGRGRRSTCMRSWRRSSAERSRSQQRNFLTICQRSSCLSSRLTS